MMRFVHSRRGLILTLLLIFHSLSLESSPRGAERDEPKAPGAFPDLRQTPLPPSDSLKMFELEHGLRIELAACEPQIVDPVSLRFCGQGKMWVVEMGDYPTPPQGDAAPRGRIRVLEDQDRDGFFETATTFAEGLDFPTGLTPYRNGVIVTLAGKIEYLEDRDGDLCCDHREIWFEGFARENEQLRANHPTWTFDGKIHVASGLRGGTIRAIDPRWPQGTGDEARLSLEGRDFRFDPAGGLWESAAGNSQFGFWQDALGRNYVCSNRNPCRLLMAEVGEVAANPLIPLSQWAIDVIPAAESSQVFSLVPTWTTSNLHAGQFTAACGVFRYESDLLAPFLGGDFFACEPTASIVARYRNKAQSRSEKGSDPLRHDPLRQGTKSYEIDLPPKGQAPFWIGPQSLIPQGERTAAANEFLASRDPWFRPVDLIDGPDGALYVVDMHRAVIEHPDWVPEQWKEAILNRAGEQAGRIYRVVPAEGDVPRVAEPIDSSRSSQSLVDRLGSSNRWQRDTAARILVQRGTFNRHLRIGESAATGETAVVDEISTLVRSSLSQSDSALLWVRGLGILMALRSISAADLMAAIEHPQAEVRALAARSSTSIHRLDAAATDSSPQVRYAWLSGAHRWATEEDTPLLLEALLGKTSDDSQEQLWLARMFSQLDPALAPSVLGTLEATPALVAAEDAELELLNPWIERSGWAGSTSGMTAILRFRSPEARSSMLEAYLRGAIRRGSTTETLTRDLSEQDQAEFRRWIDEQRRLALDPNAPPAGRQFALAIVGIDPREQSREVLLQIVRGEDTRLIPLAWEHVVSMASDEEIDRLLHRCSSMDPQGVVQLLEISARHPRAALRLVQMIQTREIPTSWLSPTCWQRLDQHASSPLKEHVAAIRQATLVSGRGQIFDQYRTTLAEDSAPADRSEGKRIFINHCASCHRIGGAGIAVGPDISDLRTQSPEQILRAVLDPNAAIDANYFRYRAITTAGQVVDGLLVDQNVKTITLAQQEGRQIILLRDDVEEFHASGVSYMPEGFEGSISAQSMRNLIDYLKNWRFD